MHPKYFVALTVVLLSSFTFAEEVLDDTPEEPKPKKTVIRALGDLIIPKRVIVVEDGAVAAIAPFGRTALPAGSRAWGPEQVVGQPNTPGTGDIQTAWASRTQDGQDEWLELEYGEIVEPTMVIVHENHNPGAVYKIVAFSKTGMGAELWSGEDPSAVGSGRGISHIKIDTPFKTKKIRIHIKSKEVAGWNEIDAVGIKDKTGKVHWAVHVRASSSYASDDMPDEGLKIKGPVVAVKKVAEADRKKLLKVQIEELRALEAVTAARLKQIQATRKASEKKLADLEKADKEVKE